jgi:hypothetical protein
MTLRQIPMPRIREAMASGRPQHQKLYAETSRKQDVAISWIWNDECCSSVVYPIQWELFWN